MSLVIKNITGVITIECEQQTPEKVKAYLNDLRSRLDTTWPGVCLCLNMPPTEASTRTMRRWYAMNDSYRPMPDDKWQRLLMLLNGQQSLMRG